MQFKLDVLHDMKHTWMVENMLLHPTRWHLYFAISVSLCPTNSKRSGCYSRATAEQQTLYIIYRITFLDHIQPLWTLQKTTFQHMSFLFVAAGDRLFLLKQLQCVRQRHVFMAHFTGRYSLYSVWLGNRTRRNCYTQRKKYYYMRLQRTLYEYTFQWKGCSTLLLSTYYVLRNGLNIAETSYEICI